VAIALFSSSRHLDTSTPSRPRHHAAITTTDRGWPNHVRVDGPSGLDRPCWIMTEQPCTLSRDRITDIAGQVSSGCLDHVRTWLADFLDL
jgi:mRNA interferase MazF